jgi:hypothetical protein
MSRNLQEGTRGRAAINWGQHEHMDIGVAVS